MEPWSRRRRTNGPEVADAYSPAPPPAAMPATSVPAPSSLLSLVLPDGPVVRELRAPGDPGTLLPAESAVLASAVESRQREFAAGRACARAALAELGIADPGPILPDQRRAPVYDLIISAVMMLVSLVVLGLGVRVALRPAE